MKNKIFTGSVRGERLTIGPSRSFPSVPAKNLWRSESLTRFSCGSCRAIASAQSSTCKNSRRASVSPANNLRGSPFHRFDASTGYRGKTGLAPSGSADSAHSCCHMHDDVRPCILIQPLDRFDTDDIIVPTTRYKGLFAA